MRLVTARLAAWSVIVACAALVGTHLLDGARGPFVADAAEQKPLDAGKKKLVIASSWTSFRNGAGQLGIAGSPLTDKLELLWSIKAGEMINGTAAILGDRVYIGSLKGELLALNLKNGERIWTCKSKDTNDPKEFLPGFKASPTVTDKFIYIGDEDGGFHCVDRLTGKRKWQFASQGTIVSSATLYKDRVLFGSHDASLYCLNSETGEKLWQYETEGMVNCSPAVVEHFTFVTGCDEHLRVIDIDTGKQVSDMPLGSYLIASPAVDGDTLFVGNHNGEVLAVDWKASKIVWTFKDPKREAPFHSSAAVTDEVVVLGGHDKLLHCLDRKTGKARWDFPTKAKITGSPVVVGDRVYFGSEDGHLYGLTLKDGKEVFKFRDGRPFSASVAIGEGCLVIGSENNDGPIYCFGKK